MIDKETLKTWANDDYRFFRAPDVFADHRKVRLGVIGIWYGPGGPKGDVATEVEFDGHGFDISEYQDIRGYSDEEPKEDEEILKTTTYIDADDLVQTLKHLNKRKPRSFKQLMQWAAGAGVAKLAYWGGEEEFVGELPR